MRFRVLCAVLLGLVTGAVARHSTAAVTPEHQKQIAEVRRELAAVLRSKVEPDVAERLLGDLENRVEQIAKDAEVDEKHILVAKLLREIRAKKTVLSRKQGAEEARPAGAAFEKDVAPIIASRCLNCHGETNPRSDLRLTTFQQIVEGCGGKL